MTDKPGGATQQFEALKKSANHLRQLRAQLEQAQQQHVSLLNEVLDAVAGNPSQLAFGIVSEKKIVAEGPLNKQTLEMLRAVGSAVGRDSAGRRRRLSRQNRLRQYRAAREHVLLFLQNGAVWGRTLERMNKEQPSHVK